jgi:hypothetical protein
MEMLIESGQVAEERLTGLMKEADELIAILTASSRTARSNLKRKSSYTSNQQSAITNQKS